MESDAWATSPTDREPKGVIGQYIHGPAIIMLKSGAGNAICFQPGFNQDFFNEGPRRPIAGAPLMNARMPHGRHEPVHERYLCLSEKKWQRSQPDLIFAVFLLVMFSVLHVLYFA